MPKKPRKTKSDEELKQARMKNLRLWQPGQSGNPGGRPKFKPFTDAMLAVIDETIPETWAPMLSILGVKPNRAKDVKVAEVLVRGLIRESFMGKQRVRAIREVMDRIEGRVPLPLIGANDGPIDIQIVSHIQRPDRRPPKSATKKS